MPTSSEGHDYDPILTPPASSLEPGGRAYHRLFPGSCYCRSIEYMVELDHPEIDAQTSICYCKDCMKWTGSAFSIMTRVPRKAFKMTKGETKHHVSVCSGVKVHRAFCGECGSGIFEYGERAKGLTYVTYGTFDTPSELPPHGEYFCKYRESWMPVIPGSSSTVVCRCWHHPPTLASDLAVAEWP